MNWMSAIKSLGAQLSEKLAEMEVICAEFGYEVTPTLLLRHERGPSFSLVLGNDDLKQGRTVHCRTRRKWRSG